MRTASFAAAMLCAAFMYVGTISPSRYDKPYRGKLTVLLGNHLVRKYCGPAPVAACAIRAPGNGSSKRCTIVMPDLSDPEFNVIYRHERSHCNGWPGYHPGWRWV
jgi:hypothetical protein